MGSNIYVPPIQVKDNESPQLVILDFSLVIRIIIDACSFNSSALGPGFSIADGVCYTDRTRGWSSD
ncbi:MAG: hypothetical protein OCD01_12525 [Fibrobacterales bacterium]